MFVTRNRFGAVSGTLAAAALAVGLSAPVAQAQDLPVTATAEGGDDCTVTFTISNKTNAPYWVGYTVDGGTTMQWVEGDPHTPAWPDDAAYKWDYTEAVDTTETITLTDLENLPTPEADSHTVTYRIARGPERDHYSTEERTVEVSGCEQAGTGSLGSIGAGSLGSSALGEGSLGSDETEEGSGSLGSLGSTGDCDCGQPGESGWSSQAPTVA